MRKYYLPLIFSFILSSGCSGPKKVMDDDIDNLSIERIYSEAKASFNTDNYHIASQLYAQLDILFPFTPYARQSLLESAYAHYRRNDSKSALNTIDRFIRIYPCDQSMDYALYLRGWIHLNKDSSLIEKYVLQNRSQRDPSSMNYAMIDFMKLVTSYSTSNYSEDASQMIIYLHNLLAQHEVDIAHYYMRRGAYIAAINRSIYLIENYSRTPSMPEALSIMARAYKILELNELSEDVLRVLKLNYPIYPGIIKIHNIRLEKKHH